MIIANVDSAYNLATFIYSKSLNCLAVYDKALLNFTLAKVELEKSNFTSTLNYCAASKSLLQKSVNKNNKKFLSLQARILDVQSLVNIYQGKMDIAAKFALQSLTTFEKAKDNEGAANANNRLGIIFLSSGEFTKGESYMKTCIRLNVERGDSTNAAIGLHMLGYSKNKQQQYDSAIFYFSYAKAVFQRHNDLLGVSKELIALGNTYMDKAMISPVLIKNKLINQAINFIHEAIAINKKLNDKQNTVALLKIVFNMNQTLGSNTTNLLYLDSAIAIANEINNKVIQVGIYKMYIDYFESNSNFKKAFEYTNLLSALNDSIWSHEKNLQVQELNLQYETAKKNEQIFKLKEKERASDLKYAKSQTWLAITVGGIVVAVLLIFLIIILFRQYRIKSISKSLGLEQKMLRSQMNPHFIFNSLSGIQSFIVNDNTKDAEIYLGKFSRLMRLILENSRNDFITLDNEIKTIENYLALQKLRFQNAFDYEIKVDSTLNIQQLGIPPMLSQPFIENCIEHGVRYLEKGGFIQINFTIENNQLNVSIKDNGVGRTRAKEIESTKQDQHISQALAITTERLQNLSHQLKYTIKFTLVDLMENQKPSGTLVTFAMPLHHV